MKAIGLFTKLRLTQHERSVPSVLTQIFASQNFTYTSTVYAMSKMLDTGRKF
jgi:hypothetical protein